MNELTVLVDYKGQLHCPHRGTQRAVDVRETWRRFAAAGYRQVVRTFEDLDLRAEDFRGRPVLYQSSQDRGLLYRSYVEDVVHALHLQGARLLPGFEALRAHHNKVFMELLRDVSGLPELQTLRARTFGTFEAFRDVAEALDYPVVLKPAAGDTSHGVALARDAREALRIARRLSASPTVADVVARLRGWLAGDPVPESLHRRKFVVQPFVPGLTGDFKVLAFGDHQWVARRSARPGDFRASGSGRPLGFPTEPPEGLLELVERVRARFDVPFASLDVLVDRAGRLHVGELQFVRFGIRLLTAAPHRFERTGGAWRVVAGPSCWEEELVRAVVAHLAPAAAALPAATGTEG